MNKAGLSILIVDDDEEDLLIAESLLHEALKGVALRLDRAASFDECLSRSAKTRYDLILLDYNLGARNGSDLIQEVRAPGLDTPVIVMTGGGSEEIAVNLLKHGVSEYLPKASLSEAVVFGAVCRAIEAHEERKTHQERRKTLQRTNHDLELWIRELETRRRESYLLSELGNALQRCASIEEAYPAIERHFSAFFSGRSGALCMFEPEGKRLRVVAPWGQRAPGKSEFDADECWGVRQGKLYCADRPGVSITCPHLDGAPSPAHLCAPLIAHDELLGLLILQGESPAGVASELEKRPFAAKSERRFAETLSEHLAIALANLKLRDALREQAIRDSLTGLFNRRYGEECLQKVASAANRHQHPLAVLMLDVDEFKSLNDRYGHECGDTVLKRVGEFFSQRSRKEDIASRYGGDEFVLVLPEVPLEVAVAHAERLRSEMKEALSHANIGWQSSPSVSIGVAAAPEHGFSPRELLKAADVALYRAKHEGRDRVVTAEVASGYATA